MNIWECEHPGCKRVAYGTGGAIGLRAIGWFYRRGPVILCPEHHKLGPEFADRQAENFQRAVEKMSIEAAI